MQNLNQNPNPNPNQNRATTSSEQTKGRVDLVSTGPGGFEQISPPALQAIAEAEIVLGYEKYLSDIAPLLVGKESRSWRMTQEIDRCAEAIRLAGEGRRVALVSNGDAGVYGMAPLVIELLERHQLWESIEWAIHPGISSLMAAAARLGAPLSQDFAVVSLSDRLTPLETIERRLAAALEADFVVAIYNPLSRSRLKPFERFLEQLQTSRNADCPLAIAHNICRPEESIALISSGELISQGAAHYQIGMSTLLIVGNSQSRRVGERFFLTPRGYFDKYAKSPLD